MTTSIFLVVATGALCALYLVFVAARAYLRFRGARVITCPETNSPAAVAVDARHAGLTAVIDVTDLRLRECSRWPERRDCGQSCLRQIESAPEDCLVRTILAKWYAEKTCVLCHMPIGVLHSWDHQPGFIGPTGEAIRCSDVRGERLPETLATHQALCWNCAISELFRQRLPNLVIDRPTADHRAAH